MNLHSTEPDTVVQLLGADPWLRFDLWAGRAWDAAEKAAAVATEIGSPISTNDDLDHRVVALFHSTGLAKDFAAMVNPLFACTGHTQSVKIDEAEDLEISMLIDNEDLE